MNPFTIPIHIDVNGAPHDIDADTRWTLLHVLRDVLGLTGAKRGCDRGECGACTVLVDDAPVNACMTLAATCDGSRVRTIEGLGSSSSLNPLQQAFLDNDGAQCGFCTPGILMSATALLEAKPHPTGQEIREALAGNICRCNAYGRIIASVRQAGQPQ